MISSQDYYDAPKLENATVHVMALDPPSSYMKQPK